MTLKWFPKRTDSPLKNNLKHDSEKQGKISSKGRPKAPKMESRVAQRRRKGPQGAARTSLKLALFTLFRSPTPRRPHDLPKLVRGSQKLAQSIPNG